METLSFCSNERRLVKIINILNVEFDFINICVMYQMTVVRRSFSEKYLSNLVILANKSNETLRTCQESIP